MLTLKMLTLRRVVTTKRMEKEEEKEEKEEDRENMESFMRGNWQETVLVRWGCSPGGRASLAYKIEKSLSAV